MRSYIGLLFSLFCLVSCNRDQTRRKLFNVIDFTYFNNSPNAFSVKITPSDTVYLVQYFSNIPSQFRDTSIYRGVLNDQLKRDFESLIPKLQFRQYDAAYDTRDIDGEEYYIFFDNSSTQKLVYVHSTNAPKELQQLKDLIFKVRQELSFSKKDTTVHFQSFRLTVPSEVRINSAK